MTMARRRTKEEREQEHQVLLEAQRAEQEAKLNAEMERKMLEDIKASAQPIRRGDIVRLAIAYKTAQPLFRPNQNVRLGLSQHARSQITERNQRCLSDKTGRGYPNAGNIVTRQSANPFLPRTSPDAEST